MVYRNTISPNFPINVLVASHLKYFAAYQRKGSWSVFPKKSYLEETYPILILTKSTKITRGTTIDVSNISPGFIIQTDSLFFDVEIIHVFNSSF